MAKEIYHTGNWFKILLESEKDGAHFALAETKHDRRFSDMYKLEFINRTKDLKSLGKKGNYFLLWGPSDDPEYKCHGLTSLSGPRGGRRRFDNVVKDFFEVVKNSEKQSFHFTDEGHNVSVSIN